MFSEKDLEQIASKGISLQQIEQQLGYFRSGFPYVRLHSPAIAGNGIKVPDADESCVRKFTKSKDRLKIMKFTPASGAASRMFAHLYAFRESYTMLPEQLEALDADDHFNSAAYFIKNLEKFAFYPALVAVMKQKGMDANGLYRAADYNSFINTLLNEDGLGYGSLPKALIDFHDYNGHARTAAEEHLVEGAGLCRDTNGNVDMHFTLSPEHIGKFNQLMDRVKNDYENMLEVKFRISLSIQETATDTIAVDEHNMPFRNADGSLVFRPGGHGALISNLNQLDTDLIFIKNIDNIVPDRLRPENLKYKMLLAGWLLNIQEYTFGFIEKLLKPDVNEDMLHDAGLFVQNELSCHVQESFSKQDKEVRRLKLLKVLNRPIRVCGMVKNQGEPGGGPFFVKDNMGSSSLQIVESSQVDMNDSGQKEIFSKSTHFNPVDLICGVRDYKGEKFNLHDFVDHNTGFISFKSKDGKPLKALELPGLWNGAMAKWNTVFVEVPLITFNPVKTINDLLRPEHCG